MGADNTQLRGGYTNKQLRDGFYRAAIGLLEAMQRLPDATGGVSAEYLAARADFDPAAISAIRWLAVAELSTHLEDDIEDDADILRQVAEFRQLQDRLDKLGWPEVETASPTP
jgi:hypothetical protein